MAATWAGVALALRHERKRRLEDERKAAAQRREEEQASFRRLLHSVLEESKVNAHYLDLIEKGATPGRAILVELQTTALSASLVHPLTYEFAKASLNAGQIRTGRGGAEGQ